MYFPGGICGKTYKPLLSLVALSWKPLAGLSSDTCAPGSTAPEGSVTAPRTDVTEVWAQASPRDKAKMKRLVSSGWKLRSVQSFMAVSLRTIRGNKVILAARGPAEV